MFSPGPSALPSLTADKSPAVRLVIPTHTTQNLAACLASLARQTRPADSIVLTCDGDDPEIERTAESTWARVRGGAPRWGPLLIVRRPHTGAPRLNQVRNNGLRALDRAVGIADSDLIVVLDGDTVLDETALERHRALASRRYAAILPHRIDLGARRSGSLTVERLLDLGAPLPLARLCQPEDIERLTRRHRRARRQIWLRRFRADTFGLQRSHKPRLLGGHHAVRADLLRAVNGYDEHFRGDGTDDDDLARRLYMLRPRIRVTCPITDILAFHLHHETRRPWGPAEAPDHARFAQEISTPFAQRGWTSPLDQPELQISQCTGALRPVAAAQGARA